MRSGDVVELYAYLSSASGDTQVLSLGQEHTYEMGSSPANRWTVSAPVASGYGTPYKCEVAVQSTHAFQGAGSAGS